MKAFTTAIKLVGARLNPHAAGAAQSAASAASAAAAPINVDLTTREHGVNIFTNSYALGESGGPWDTAFVAITTQVVTIRSAATFASLALRLLSRLPTGGNVVVTASRSDPASSLCQDFGTRYGFSGTRSFKDPFTSIALPPDTHYITVAIADVSAAQPVHLGFTFTFDVPIRDGKFLPGDLRPSDAMS